MDQHYVYAICSLNRNYIYKGMTQDVIVRFHRHNNGFERTTKPYRPFILIYSEECESRIEARKCELFLKSSVGQKMLQRVRQIMLALYKE